MGTPGAQGLQGIQGLTGIPGADGANGVNGAAGARGPPGSDGDPGEDGMMGPPSPSMTTPLDFERVLSASSVILPNRSRVIAGDFQVPDGTTLTVSDTATFLVL
jgi:hypothetical protein